MARRLLRACWCAALLAPLGLAVRGSAKPPDLPLGPQDNVRPQLLDPDAAGTEDAAPAAGFRAPAASRPRPEDFTPLPLLPPIIVEEQPTGELQFGLGVNTDIGLVGSVIVAQACETPCEPVSPRRELLPVPSLYRLRPSVRRQVMGSLLFSVHPLMALTPTDRLLDCPSDHPQMTVAQAPSAWASADSPKPSCGVCPGTYPRPADRLVYQFTTPDLTRDLQHNLEMLQAAHRLMHLAEHLALSGRVCEALDCFDVVCRLCPGRFEGRVAEIMAQVFSPVYSGASEDAEDGAAEELPAPKEEAEEKATDKEREIEHKLNTPVSMNFVDQTLKTVLDDIHSWNNINIYVDEPALVQEGISLDHPITIRLEQVSLKSALNLILHNLHLTYVIKDEVLQITTMPYARGKLMTATYKVADLVRPGKWKGKAEKKNDVDTLIRLITSTIEPRSWDVQGGRGIVDYHTPSRSLVVNQTADIHEQVVDLLSALRRLMEKEFVPSEETPCPSACPKCERLHAAHVKGAHEQVEGLMRACRLAAEAGRHAKAAELAREAYAMDAERVMADPLVYKMHLMALKRDKGKARCRPDRASEECEPSCPRTEEGNGLAPATKDALEPPPVDASVVGALERLLEESEARPEEGPHHSAVSLHGRYFDVDCTWTGLHVRGQLPVRSSLYHLQFWNGAVSGWVTPNPAILTPERVDGAIQ
ncbi:MAG TPA: hypothetical protein VFE78_25365 [Gemmataceae bacterium]|jgi:hypothetical protein|nr:hypothetical protein [Gemmataceae bacterium]